MTKVIFFEDFYCYEYQADQGVSRKIHYYLYSPVYEILPVIHQASTHWEYPREETVLSSDFLPIRAFRHPED